MFFNLFCPSSGKRNSYWRRHHLWREHAHSLVPKMAFSKIPTPASVFEKMRFRWPFWPDTCGRQTTGEKSSVSNKNGYVRTVHCASKRKGTKEWVLQSWTNNLPFWFLPNAKNGSTVFFFRNGMSMWKNLSEVKKCLQKLRIIYRANLSFYRGRNWIVWCCYNKQVLTQQHHSCALKLTLHAQTQLSVTVS